MQSYLGKHPRTQGDGDFEQHPIHQPNLPKRIPWSTVLLEKQTAGHLKNKLPHICMESECSLQYSQQQVTLLAMVQINV
jgi:hypothetical protein